MNIDVETFEKIGPGEGLVVRTDDELEIQYSSPRASPVSGTQRRLWSTRAASLLDDQDDDDDDENEAVAEPGLEFVTDDEESDSSDSSQSKGDDCANERLLITFSKSSCQDKFDSPKDCIEASQPSSLARLSENISGMTTYFCPSTFEKDADDIRLQTAKTLAWKQGHTRDGSETDSFQQMVSYGPCGSNTIFNAAIESLDRNSDNRSSQSGSLPIPASQLSTSPVPLQLVLCSDLGMLDLRQHLISDISLILGSTTEATDNLMDTVQMWLAVVPSGASGQKRVRNRCALHHGQSRRIKNLWNQWHFKTDTNGVEHDHEPQIARSFDDIDVTSGRSTPPVEFVDLYYDSDPEIFTTTNRSRASRNYCADTIDTDVSFGSAAPTLPETPTAARRTRGCSFDTRCSASKSFSTMPSLDAAAEDESQKFDLWDDETVKDFVKDLTVGNINLVWHTSANLDNLSNSSSSRKGSPISVQGWFETGSRLQKALIHPKFMWRETYQPDIENRKLSISCRAPSSLDLLTIIRILKPANIDRTAYPYAKLDNSLTIKNHDGEVYLFEAKSTGERDWFVHGLKLLVARLASMIIVGDDQMFLEFFSPWANSPVVEQFSIDSTNKGKEAGSEDKNTSAKPSYVSTTNEDRQELWGTQGTTR